MALWNMVTEGNTGFPGSFGRQVTLDRESTGSAKTRDRLGALEKSAAEGAVVLQGEGIFVNSPKATAVELQFQGGAYVQGNNKASFSRAKLVSRAAGGRFVGTLTAASVRGRTSTTRNPPSGASGRSRSNAALGSFQPCPVTTPAW